MRAEGDFWSAYGNPVCAPDTFISILDWGGGGGETGGHLPFCIHGDAELVHCPFPVGGGSGWRGWNSTPNMRIPHPPAQCGAS